MGEKHLTGRQRIAFAHMPGESWSAGIYYLKNLFCALQSLDAENRPEIILLVREETVPREYNELVPFVAKVLHRPTLERKSFFAELIFKIEEKVGFISRRENPISIFLKKQGVDLFFTPGPPPPNFFLPFLSWIPDFQHIYYPEYFSELEIQNRNTSFECSARNATRIVLSSHSAMNDFREFAPWAIEKARVLSFVAQVSDKIYQIEPKFICNKYNIPEKYILLPNQFWKHKNHELVVQALQIALEREPHLTIVCTGNTNEYRDQLYFSNLLCLFSTTGTRERMIVLGLVPRQDLFFLIRQSLAVLQPSLFEGWNTTVEEVKSLGKKIIISDLPVHREQDATSAIYFEPTDAQSLARCLLNTFSSSLPGPDLELEKKAKKFLVARTKYYGKQFLKIAKEVV